MSESLEAIFDGQHVGTLSYANDRLMFRYNKEWQDSPDAFPLSLSMPLVIEQIRSVASVLPDAAQIAREEVIGLLGNDSAMLEQLDVEISKRARTCLAKFSA